MISLNHQLHDKDFYAWTKQTAQIVIEGSIAVVDINNIAEEIEDMGSSNKRALISCLAILSSHLLKWKFQKERRGKSWLLTIKCQRLKINDLLEESPSLKHQIESKFDRAYIEARLIASKETGIDIDDFPENDPFTLEECLNDEFFPD
jgi:hypothetical protein